MKKISEIAQNNVEFFNILAYNIIDDELQYFLKHIDEKDEE